MNSLSQVFALLISLWLVALAWADVDEAATDQSKGEVFQRANRIVDVARRDGQDAARTDGQDAARTDGQDAARKVRQESERKAKAYLVVNLETGAVRMSDEPPELEKDACRTTEMWLRYVPAGTFYMGSPEHDTERADDETEHRVTLTKDFYIGVFECTQRQWELVMGNNPAKYMGDDRPVECVSYNMLRGNGTGWPTHGHEVEATSFLGRLRAKSRLDVDLPTEAQWEYACRAKTSSAFNSGQEMPSDVKESGLYDIGRFEYYRQKDGKGGYLEHTRVGCYQPNDWGLYDMHGNVWEWCLDWRGTYPEEDATDPKGPLNGKKRVIRGGAWNLKAEECRSANRGGSEPQSNYYGFGFRVVCPVEQALSVVREVESYLVVDLANWGHRFEKTGPDLTSEKCKTAELWLQRIPSGGYMGVFEVTQAQWERVMGENPARFKGACRPVETVSYGDGEAFMGKLLERTGLEFGLPSEAQWEGACGESVDLRNEVAEHTAVGSAGANIDGLYDMFGNVEEWCKGEGRYRVARGGSWFNGKVLRHSYAPSYKFCDLGLRVVCTEVKPR